MTDKEINKNNPKRKVRIAIALFVFNHAFMLFVRESGLFRSPDVHALGYAFLMSFLMSLPIVAILFLIVVYRALNKKCGKISYVFASIFSILLIVVSSFFIFASTLAMFS